MSPHDREALRQQTLLRALWGDARPAVVLGWLRDRDQATAGLRAHQAHAAAQAERALAAAYPVLRQLVGPEALAALARRHWHQAPPTEGDLGTWGGGLADTLETQPVLAAEGYLGDVARLEWAVHQAARAADAAPASGLADLGQQDPATLRLRLAPGTALLASAHPVVSIWQAHDDPAPDAGVGASVADNGDPDAAAERARRWDLARAALALRQAETALVQRRGWRVTVRRVDTPAEAAWLAAVLAGEDLATALIAAHRAAAAGPPVALPFDVAAWLQQAVAEGLLEAVLPAGA